MLGWAGAVGCERFPALDKLMATDEALEGYVPFPPEFAERYRRLGYWEPKTFGERLGDWAARCRESTPSGAGEVARFRIRRADPLDRAEGAGSEARRDRRRGACRHRAARRIAARAGGGAARGAGALRRRAVHALGRGHPPAGAGGAHARGLTLRHEPGGPAPRP